MPKVSTVLSVTCALCYMPIRCVIHRDTADLSQVPFSELQKVQEKIGAKQFSAFLSRSTLPRQRVTPSAAVGKGRPREVTSKQPVPQYRQAVPVQKQQAVDPRFSDEYGQFDEGKFRKAYQFLDGVRQSEKDVVCKELKQAKSESNRTQLTKLLKQLVSGCCGCSSKCRWNSSALFVHRVVLLSMVPDYIQHAQPVAA